MTKDEPDEDGSITLCGSYHAGRTAALHKIDGMMRIAYGNAETTSQKLAMNIKFWHKSYFQVDHDPNHTCKLHTKWLKKNKVNDCGLQKAMISAS